MTTSLAHTNLILAWSGIVAGFTSGLLLGVGFDKEKWLGGYGSWKRRLYRLGHISFFGLAFVNFLFYFTTRGLDEMSQILWIASWAFVAGAITMPFCCLVMAHWPKCRALFAVPVLNLICGATLTLVEVARA